MRILIILVAALVVACAGVSTGQPSSDLSKVSVGMSKETVLANLGPPSRVSANPAAEYLIYLLVDNLDYTPSAASLGILPPFTKKSEYFIKIVGGKVESFGRIGDFDSAKIPETKSTIDLNIKK